MRSDYEMSRTAARHGRASWAGMLATVAMLAVAAVTRADVVAVRGRPAIVECKITKLTEFGAFAEIEDGIEGLIHISELSRERIEEPSQVVQVAEIHRAEVISIDSTDRKIALSIKSFVRRSEAGTLRQYIDDDGSSTAHLGDLLKDKLSELIDKGEEEELDDE